MQSDSGLDVLTVTDVMARYRLRDRRAARRVMDSAGAFRIGAGLFVRFADLLAFEERQRAARRQGAALPQPAQPPGTARRPLPPGWWRDVDSSRAA